MNIGIYNLKAFFIEIFKCGITALLVVGICGCSTVASSQVETSSAPTPTMIPATTAMITPTPAPTPSQAVSPDPTPTDFPTPTPGPGYFTDGSVVADNTRYISQDLYVKITNVYKNGVNYYVADIRMKTPDKVFSAFAYDKFGSKENMYPLDMANAKGAVIAVNGDYYGARPKGIVIRNGVLYRSKAFMDVAAIFKDGTMKTYLKGKITAQELMDQGALHVFSFGPTLLGKNGKALKKINDPDSVYPDNPRTGIGYYEPNHFALVVVDGRGHGNSKGMDIYEFATLFEKLGCICAYNLDGGGSSVMTFMGKIVNHPCDYKPSGGQRAISDILYFGERLLDGDNSLLFSNQ